MIHTVVHSDSVTGSRIKEKEEKQKKTEPSESVSSSLGHDSVLSRMVIRIINKNLGKSQFQSYSLIYFFTN